MTFHSQLQTHVQYLPSASGEPQETTGIAGGGGDALIADTRNGLDDVRCTLPIFNSTGKQTLLCTCAMNL